MNNNFYDTSSLLLKSDSLFQDKNENIIISSITLDELESIKTSVNKDAEIKFSARRVLELLNSNPNKYTVWIFKESMLKPIMDKGLSAYSSDMKILASAINYDKIKSPDETTFITNDLALKNIANLFFGSDSIQSINKDLLDAYNGICEVCLNEDEMAYFYSHLDKNIYNLYINQYINIKNENNQIVDQLCWNGNTHRMINFIPFESEFFGKTKAIDPYQKLLFDSFKNNQITLVSGSAGSGKSYLSLSYLFSKLESGDIDRIVVFCNPIATANSVRLGFYKGTRDEKLLDSQIGNFLASKLGDRSLVEKLVLDGKLLLLPMSDIRGYDTSGTPSGVYITEAQNLDIQLMKLALQRVGEHSICIIDGDYFTQVDDSSYSGSNNGMKRVSKVFRGHDIYGEVTLKNIYRSKIAKIADEM